MSHQGLSRNTSIWIGAKRKSSFWPQSLTPLDAPALTRVFPHRGRGWWGCSQLWRAHQNSGRLPTLPRGRLRLPGFVPNTLALTHFSFSRGISHCNHLSPPANSTSSYILISQLPNWDQPGPQGTQKLRIHVSFLTWLGHLQTAPSSH